MILIIESRMPGKTIARNLIALGIAFTLCAHPQETGAQTWKTLLDEADSLQGAENVDSAIAIGKLALEQAEQSFGVEDTVVARVLYRLAIYNLSKYFLNDFPLVESYLKQSLAIRQKCYGKEHRDVAATLVGLAVLYSNHRLYADAEPLIKRAMAIYEKVLGPDDPATVKLVQNMGIFYYRQGKYAQAEPFFLRFLGSLEKSLGPDHPEVALCLLNLAGVYLEQGKSEQAESLYVRSLSTSEAALGPEHPLVAECLNGLGCIRLYQGEYAQAEAAYSRSLAIRENTVGPEHLDVALMLNNLATLAYDLGQYSKAELLIERSLAVTEKALGPNHPDVAVCYNNLSNVYRDQGRLADAKAAAERSLFIRENLYGTDHLEVSKSLTSLAVIYRNIGDYIQAESAQKRSLDIVERILGPQHPSAATCLANLGCIYKDRGLYAEAESLYNQSLTIFDGSLGPDHPNVAASLEYMCGLYRILGRRSEATELAERAYHVRQSSFAENGIVLSERDALTFSRSFRDAANLYLTCFSELDERDRATNREAADVILSCKGNVSDQLYSRHRAIVDERDSALVTLAESLRSTKYQLSKYFVEGPEDKLDYYKLITDSLSALANELDAELSRRSASFRRQKDLAHVSVARIHDILPEGAILIEFLRYKHYRIESDNAIDHYAALVITGKDTSAIVGLGQASEIDSLVGRYRGHMARAASYGTILDEDQNEYAELSAALCRRVWRPIENFTVDKQLVLIAPDGALNLVSFAGFRDSTGTFLDRKSVV